MLCFPSIVVHKDRCEDMLLAAIEWIIYFLYASSSLVSDAWKLDIDFLGVVDGFRCYSCSLELEHSRSGSSDVEC